MIDLRTRDGVEKFKDLYGTRTGRWLANRLNLSGAGSEILANQISSFAWNGIAAFALYGVQLMKGHDTTKNHYRDYCNNLSKEIVANPLFPSRSFLIGNLRLQD